MRKCPVFKKNFPDCMDKTVKQVTNYEHQYLLN